jgi:hypothetical protein
MPVIVFTSVRFPVPAARILFHAGRSPSIAERRKLGEYAVTPLLIVELR